MKSLVQAFKSDLETLESDLFWGLCELKTDTREIKDLAKKHPERTASKVTLRMEFVVFDCLDGDCGGGAEDGFHACGPGDLGGGPREAENDLAVILGACEMLE